MTKRKLNLQSFFFCSVFASGDYPECCKGRKAVHLWKKMFKVDLENINK